MFVQVYCFVMFNKVMTAQYYIWYMVFFPLILVNSRMIDDRKGQGFFLFVTWWIGQGVWGYYANAFENEGKNTLLEIHMVNCCWLVANMCFCMTWLFNSRIHLQAEFSLNPKDEDDAKKKVEAAK